MEYSVLSHCLTDLGLEYLFHIDEGKGMGGVSRPGSEYFHVTFSKPTQTQPIPRFVVFAEAEVTRLSESEYRISLLLETRRSPVSFQLKVSPSGRMLEHSPFNPRWIDRIYDLKQSINTKYAFIIDAI